MIKKSPLSDLEVKRNNRLYDLMKLDKEDVLVDAFVAKNDAHLLMASHNCQFIRLDLSDVNAIGLKSKGIIGMRLRADDFVTCAQILHDESDIVLMSDRDQFKRIKSSDVSVNNRATLGVLCARKVKSNPHHIAAISVGNIQDSLLLYTDKIHNLDVKDIPLMDFDASFSSPIKLENIWIIRPITYAFKEVKPQENVFPKTEPLKLDL